MTDLLLTYEQRKAHIMVLMEDTDIELGEKLKHIYHWMRLEFALRDRQKAALRIEKHANWLDDNEEVYQLRKDLSTL